MKKKNMIIIINEQHTLLPAQKEHIRILGYGDTYAVPSCGITIETQQYAAKALTREYRRIVFVSPVPIMLAHCVLEAQGTDTYIYVFANDHREKKELPNGKIITTVAREGWQLIKIC